MTCSHTIGSRFNDKVFEVIKNGISSTSGTTEHTHEISDINGLETTLSSSLSYIQELILKITGVQSALDGNADKEHTHTISEITDLTVSESIYGDSYTTSVSEGTEYLTLTYTRDTGSFGVFTFTINDNFDADKFSQFNVLFYDSDNIIY